MDRVVYHFHAFTFFLCCPNFLCSLHCNHLLLFLSVVFALNFGLPCDNFQTFGFSFAGCCRKFLSQVVYTICFIVQSRFFFQEKSERLFKLKYDFRGLTFEVLKFSSFPLANSTIESSKVTKNVIHFLL